MHRRPSPLWQLLCRRRVLALAAAACALLFLARRPASLRAPPPPPPPPPAPRAAIALASSLALALAPAITTAHADFCRPATADPAPALAGAFARVLFEGAPGFWLVPPPEFSFLLEEGWRGGGAVVKSFTAQYTQPFQSYFAGAPPGALLVDVGGNVGLAALPVAALGFRVIAFEPVPSNLRAFSLSVCFNGFADRVTLVGAAVAAAAGSMDIFVPRGRADNTALSPAAASANVGGAADAFTVPVVALDGFLRAEDVRDLWLLKIDVQGFELGVMEGARAVLSALPREAWVVAEHDPKLMAAAGVRDATADIAFMASLGFSAHLVWRGAEVPPAEWATVPLETYGRDMFYQRR
jgi:FkbM family methyltransferase